MRTLHLRRRTPLSLADCGGQSPHHERPPCTQTPTDRSAGAPLSRATCLWSAQQGERASRLLLGERGAAALLGERGTGARRRKVFWKAFHALAAAPLSAADPPEAAHEAATASTTEKPESSLRDPHPPCLGSPQRFAALRRASACTRRASLPRHPILAGQKRRGPRAEEIYVLTMYKTMQ